MVKLLMMQKMFNIIGPVVLLTVLWGVLVVHILQTRQKTPYQTVVIDRGSYELILGRNAISIFTHYDSIILCGLNFYDARKRIKEGGTYIDGLTNDFKGEPFMFLNIGSLQDNYSDGLYYTAVMHECMHMAGIIYGGCWDSHEEEMITWAEKEANEIIKILKSKNFIK